MKGTIYMDNYRFDFQYLNQRYHTCEAAFGLSYLTFMTNLFEFFLIGMLFMKFVDIDTKFTNIQNYCRNYFNKSNDITNNKETPSKSQSEEEQSEEEQSEEEQSEEEQSEEEQSEEEQSEEEQSEEEQSGEEQSEEEQSEEEQSGEEQLEEEQSGEEQSGEEQSREEQSEGEIEYIKRFKTLPIRTNRFERNFRGLRGGRPMNIGLRNRFGSSLPYVSHKPFKFRPIQRLERDKSPINFSLNPFRTQTTETSVNEMPKFTFRDFTIDSVYEFSYNFGTIK
jgi:flagellar motor protein MotB